MLANPVLAELVARHITEFGERHKTSIEKISLIRLLAKKNPYLFIARQVNTLSDLAQELATATLSSSEETMFGNTLEAIAIDICAVTYGGHKSAAAGIDLEFMDGSCRYLISIKSGPNWGNSSQVKRLKQDFARAVALIRQNNPTVNVLAVNGCCYGSGSTDYGTYRKVCGPSFWELISGDPDLYLRLVEPIRTAASNGFVTERAQLIERLAAELAESWTLLMGNLTGRLLLEGGVGRPKPVPTDCLVRRCSAPSTFLAE